MLASADHEVVRRDPELPGLRVLLNPEALAGLLAERTGELCRVVPGRLRYKPRTSCVLSFELHTLDGKAPVPGIAKAYTLQTLAKAEKTVRGLGASDVLAADWSSCLVITTLAGDRDLPAVGRLVDDRARLPILERLLPGTAVVAAGNLRTLRHNPERRWVGLLDAGGQPIVLRAYSPSASGQHIRAYSRLEGESLRTPTLLGKSRRHGLIAVSWIPGATMRASSPEEQFRSAGVALAQLHGSRAKRLHLVTAGDHARHVYRAAAQVSELVPDLRAAAQELTALLCSRLTLMDGRVALLHGDFSADQVVIGATGTTSLVDLDSAHLGHPAEDLGSIWAATLAESRTPEEASEATLRVTALAEGYRSVLPLPSPDTVMLFRDIHLVRRAGEAFRMRRPDWQERLEWVVSLARRGADATTTGTSPW